MSLKIISWNLFMHDFDFSWRIENICKQISSHNPDIICLQEVIPEFWIIIKKHFPTYLSAYAHPFTNNTTDRCYGEVILSKLPIIDKDFFQLRSYQGRVNTWIDVKHVKHNNEIIRVNTSHLESFREDKYKKMRQIQLFQIEKANETKDKWIWIGDSNIRDDEKHSMYIPSGTDTATYHHSRFWKDESYEMEYDKVWTNNVTVTNWSKIGTEKIDDKWLSDHDGLLVTIDF